MNIKIYTLLYILLVYERELSIIIIIIIIIMIIIIIKTKDGKDEKQPERMELKKTHDTDVPFFKKSAA